MAMFGSSWLDRCPETHSIEELRRMLTELAGLKKSCETSKKVMETEEYNKILREVKNNGEGKHE